jgi:hypothetical protein
MDAGLAGSMTSKPRIVRDRFSPFNRYSTRAAPTEFVDTETRRRTGFVAFPAGPARCSRWLLAFFVVRNPTQLSPVCLRSGRDDPPSIVRSSFLPRLRPLAPVGGFFFVPAGRMVHEPGSASPLAPGSADLGQIAPALGRGHGC